MRNDNYPAGVTDAHPHFNPSETLVEVECTTEEALVIPSFAVKAQLIQLKDFTDGFTKVAATGADKDRFISLSMMIGQLQRQIDEMEREGDYECQWKGEQELPVSPDAEWDCPRCGVTQSTDTLPDEREDEDYFDRMQESRYDD